jgi:hypothetical protein
MVAAAITPSVVQKKTDEVVDQITGTSVRVTEYLLKATKVTQNDWILPQTALSITDITGDIVGWTAVTNDSSNDMVEEALTYTDATDKLTMTSATVGTTWITLKVKE